MMKVKQSKQVIVLLFVPMVMVANMLLAPKIGEASLTATSGQLVSYWEMEETTGSRVDSAGNNDLSENNSVTYNTGIIGNGAEFTRANSEYLSIADASQTGLDLGVSTSFTISMWVKSSTWAYSYGLISKYGNASTMSWKVYFSGNTLYHHNSDNGTNLLYPYYAWSPSTNVWYHMCEVYDLSVPSNTTYINGTSIGSGTTYSSFYDNANPFLIGVYYNGTYNDYFTGIIDEVSIWSTALSENDCDYLWNSGTGVSYADLWPVSTTSTTTTTTTTTDVSELIWVVELYLSMFLFLLFTYIGYRFTKLFI